MIFKRKQSENHQFVFDLPVRTLFERQDFFIAQCNKEAVALIDSLPSSQLNAAIICGEKGAGKTHLAHLFAETIEKKINKKTVFITNNMLSENHILDVFQKERFFVLENIELGVDEKSLFHALNIIKNVQGFLLMTSETSYMQWGITLPDLKSRLASIPQISLGLPDDAVLRAVLLKLFADRQLKVVPETIDYLLKNMNRSFAFACDIVKKADQMSLMEKKQITVPMLRRLLKND